MKLILANHIPAYRHLQAQGAGLIFVEVTDGKHKGARGLFSSHSNPNASHFNKAYVDIVTTDGTVHTHPKHCQFYWL